MYKIVIILFCFGLSTLNAQTTKEIESKKFAETYKRNIQKSRLNGIYIPKDIDDAMKQLDRKSDATAAASFKSAPEDVVAKKLHFGLGRWMIHNWNLEFGSRLSHQLTELGLKHYDDMAQVLIRCYHRYLNDKPLNPKPIVLELIEAREREKAARFTGKTMETLSSKKIDSSN